MTCPGIVCLMEEALVRLHLSIATKGQSNNAIGKDTTGVFRPSNGAFYLKNVNSTGFADIQINYGIGGR